MGTTRLVAVALGFSIAAVGGHEGAVVPGYAEITGPAPRTGVVGLNARTTYGPITPAMGHTNLLKRFARWNKTYVSLPAIAARAACSSLPLPVSHLS
jgi:hypothetical protein